ncbi:MAG: hypothetical protein GF308_04630 [Candidatus Heimdallarchaeota archaeon]|nr:hypothetical protein [Candidatus Heimdallarchaeota archaeon]
MSSDYDLLVGNVAADKESKRSGRIIRVDKLLNSEEKKLTPHLAILVKRLLKKDVVVPLSAKIITRVEGYYVWFDISN